MLLGVVDERFRDASREPEDDFERLEKLGKLRFCRDAPLDIRGVPLFLLEISELSELGALRGPSPCANDDGKLPTNESIEPDGIENLTSERTGIKIIPLFESAITFIKGSSVDNEEAAALPDCTPPVAAAPAAAPAAPSPRLSNVRIFSGILICLIFIAGFLEFWSFFLFGSESI